VAKRQSEPKWPTRLVVDAVHHDQLREHGGLPGVRDENALESALARPRQKWHYAESKDLCSLAAAYAFGLVTSHPYRDGNKRIGFLAMVTFLGVNDRGFEAPEAEVIAEFLALADGQVSEDALAAWIKAHTPKRR
jgi:death-on-curing protein